ncbi:MAG: uroporphyrinogen decarboxylase family protein [Planctomycetota bacterium]
MPDFANLRKALLCQGEPDRVPPLEYHVDNAIQARFLGRPVDSIENQAEFFLSAGYDFVPVALGMRRTLVERAARPEALEQRGHMKTLEAAYSANQPQPSTRLWAEEGSGLVTDQTSFDNFDWPDPDGYNFHDVARLGEILPPEAKVIPLVGYVFAASWMLMGFERFCLDLAEGGGLAARVVRKIGRIHHRIVENLLQYDCVGAVCMPDDLAYATSLMVSPDFLRKEVFPWHKRIGDLVRAKDLPYLFHSDGRYLPVIDDLIECGYHAIHPCEPASMEMVELKRRYGGRLCLCGNINLDSTLTLGTSAEVEEEVKLRIRTVGPGGGYCCGSSNSVTEYVPFENYLAMLEATKKYGEYPL